MNLSTIWSGLFVLCGSILLNACPSLADDSISTQVKALRQLTESAQKGELSPDQIRSLQTLRIFISQSTLPASEVQPKTRTAADPPLLIDAKAQREDAVPVNCIEIQQRFYQAKAYWSQLLCLANRIIQLSAKPCPDLHCINQLRREADALKAKIDVLYPPEWDNKSIHFSRSWKSDHAIEFKDYRSLNWHNVYWPTLDSVPATIFAFKQDGVDVAQDLSVTNYCLESIRMTLEFDAMLAGTNDKKFGVRIQF